MAAEILVLGSTEGKEYQEYLVKQINRKLRDHKLYNSHYECVGWWDDDVWENGSTTLGSLYTKGLSLKENGGFVIAFISPDDLLHSRNQTYCVGRDNVWLEYGLFSGILGYRKVFLLIPDNGSLFTFITPNGNREIRIGTDYTFHLPSDIGSNWYMGKYFFLGSFDVKNDRLMRRFDTEIDKIFKKIYNEICPG